MPEKKLPPMVTEFDGLRGVAIICVLLIHTVTHYWGEDTPFKWFGVSQWGQLGVPLFFAISGFCISFGIFKRAAAGKANSSVDFARRRWHRIYPPYVLAMIITLVKNLIVGHPAVSAGQMPFVLFHNLTLTQVLRPDLPPINPAYWSLCVEFQFYLMFGVWLALLGTRRPRVAAVFSILLFIASIGFIIVQDYVTPVIPAYSWFMAFPRSAPLFFFGAAVAWLNIRLAMGGQVGRAHKLVFAAIASSLIFCVTLGWLIALLIVIAGLAHRIKIFSRPSKFMNWPPLVYLGERSYSIYLIHGIGVAVLSEYGAKMMAHHFVLGLGMLVITWTVCISTGLIYYHFVERHFLRTAHVN